MACASGGQESARMEEGKTERRGLSEFLGDFCVLFWVSGFVLVISSDRVVF